jgi:cytochrome c peroxidase
MATFARAQSSSSPLLPPPLPQLNRPGDSSESIDLGKQLFFDVRLSRNDRVSCATCHDPAKAFTNGERLAVGVDGKRGVRRVPRLVNVAHSESFFWDGRAKTLEEQALVPIQHPDEMDMPLPALEKKLVAIPDYRDGFRRTFGDEVTEKRIGQALAAYERTMISNDTPFDRWLKGDKSSLTPAAVRGMELFFGEARCAICHKGPNLSDGKFHNIGVSDPDDPGRQAVSRNEKDHGAFRTPQLREVGRTGPYMHDGRLKTLAEVVRHYNFGGVTDERNDHRDEELRVLYLGDDQAADLVAFLRDGLTTPTKKSESRP